MARRQHAPCCVVVLREAAGRSRFDGSILERERVQVVTTMLFCTYLQHFKTYWVDITPSGSIGAVSGYNKLRQASQANQCSQLDHRLASL